ncbi:outer membrane porin, OprD family [Pseudomonas sp. GW456-L14]|uniref:OprD family porin n=1 Tax=Pseudomonas TaxID=286 RepID=UPI0008B6C00F|nr:MULTISPECIES: OprD family porin [unclassified Pseudomonas]PMY32877.1 outer membrane porin, OprD family [Pseudomonas sp. GW456-L14]PMY49865.1 outer membrane porin, OprD family [Pseudomonas sp. GW456-L12]SEM08381.1 imipenem/basic amino acid-specific outer membrane pore [Pseudomonas sp. NFACC41-3]SMH27897.1 imipenem/basic amino acid-specific outer membrane pore [Pseudomonas sp. NFIX51]
MKPPLWSALPLAISTCLGQLAYAASDHGFVEDSSLTLTNRNFYFYRNNLNNPGAQNYRNEWAHGVLLDYRSGYTQGTVGFGIDAFAQVGIKLDSGKGRSGTGLLPLDSDGRAEDEYSEAGGALKMRISKTELKYGNLTPLNPVFGTGNARLFTQQANGFQLTSSELNGLLLDAGHFTSGNDSASTNDDGALKALYAGVETRSVDYLGGVYSLNDQLSVSLYGSQFTDIWRQYYANASYTYPVSASQSLNLDFNIYRTNDTGQSLAGKIDNTTWSLAGSYKVGAHRLTLAYQRVDGDEPFDYLGFDQQPGTSIFLANSIQIVDFNAPNERSWQLRYDLDMAPFGVPGLSFMSRYVSGDHIDDSHYDGGVNGAYGRYGSDGKRWERDIEARYIVQSGKAKDLSLRVRQGSLRSTSQVARADTTDNNEVRLIIEYPLSIF